MAKKLVGGQGHIGKVTLALRHNPLTTHLLSPILPIQGVRPAGLVDRARPLEGSSSDMDQHHRS